MNGEPTDYEAAIQQFLVRYGEALSAGDLRVIVDCWGIPAVVLSDNGIQPVDDPKQVEEFFSNAIANYTSQDLVSTQPQVQQVEQLSQSLFSVDVVWSNQDANGVEQSHESWRYTLQALPGEPMRIHVAILKTDAR